MAYTPAETGYAETNGAEAISATARLVDTLPTGMEYVPGSAKLNGAALADGAGIICGCDETARTLTVPIPSGSEAGTAMVLTYDTRMTGETVRELWESGGARSFSNTVRGLDTEDTEIPALRDSATAAAGTDWVKNHAALNKSGSYSFTGGTRTAEWTVTVHTVGRSFQYLNVVDTLGKGLALDTGSVRVNGEAAGTY